jgi:hypothetical protein
VKTQIFKLNGTPQVGDSVVIEYRSPRGGCTAARATATENDTSLGMAQQLINQITQIWLAECFQARVKGVASAPSLSVNGVALPQPPAPQETTIVIQCTDHVDDVAFHHRADGAVKITHEEF